MKMNKKMFCKKFFAAILFFAFFAIPAFAAPGISNISGMVEHGQAITVSGSGFGTKSPATPLLWDNFESYTLNQAPSGYDVRTGTPIVQNSNGYANSKAVQYYTHGSSSTQWQDMIKDTGGTFSTVAYVRMKNYLNLSSVPDHYQWKNLRITSSHGYSINDESTTSVILMDSWHDTTRWYNNGSPLAYYNGGTYGGGGSAPATLFPLGEWYDVEYIATRSLPASTANGSVVINTNGVNKVNKTGLITHDLDDGIWRYLYLGGTVTSCYDANNVSIACGDSYIYYDDLYADITQSRVEICSGSTWSSRGQCEIQIPSVWDSGGTSITATVNQGAFSDASNQYLYVVDSTGTANANGYEITFSGIADTVAPSAPASLAVI